MLPNSDATLEEHLEFATDLYINAVKLDQNPQPNDEIFAYTVGVFEGYMLCLFKNEVEKERYVKMIHDRVAALIEDALHAPTHHHP
jgi:hypothetical protein